MENSFKNKIENREEAPSFKDLTIFTATFYGEDETSKVRQKLALKLFENAKELGVKCVVADGGSNEEFLEKARAYTNVVLSVEKSLGMGERRREALRIAHDELPSSSSSGHFFLWIEPEKDGLITAENLTKMIKSLRENNSDIVVPERQDMSSLPHFQAWMEQRANKKAMQLTDKDIEEVWDIWFGPKMFNEEGLKYFLNYKGKLDKWDATIKPVMDAYKDNKRVVSVPVDYTYDETQKENEEGSAEFKKKRIEQYLTILTEMGDEFSKRKLIEQEEKNK